MSQLDRKKKAQSKALARIWVQRGRGAQQMEVSIVMGVPQARWLIYFMDKSQSKNDDDWGYPYDSENPHIDRREWVLPEWSANKNQSNKTKTIKTTDILNSSSVKHLLGPMCSTNCTMI